MQLGTKNAMACIPYIHDLFHCYEGIPLEANFYERYLKGHLGSLGDQQQPKLSNSTFLKIQANRGYFTHKPQEPRSMIVCCNQVTSLSHKWSVGRIHVMLIDDKVAYVTCYGTMQCATEANFYKKYLKGHLYLLDN